MILAISDLWAYFGHWAYFDHRPILTPWVRNGFILGLSAIYGGYFSVGLDILGCGYPYFSINFWLEKNLFSDCRVIRLLFSVPSIAEIMPRERRKFYKTEFSSSPMASDSEDSEGES